VYGAAQLNIFPIAILDVTSSGSKDQELLLCYNGKDKSENRGQLKLIQECALVQSEATLIVLRLEPIKVLFLIGRRTKEHSWINFNCPWFSDSHCKCDLRGLVCFFE